MCEDRYPKKWAHSCGVCFTVAAILFSLSLRFCMLSLRRLATTANRTIMIRVTAARMRKNRVLSTYIVFRKRLGVKRIMNLESTEPAF